MYRFPAYYFHPSLPSRWCATRADLVALLTTDKLWRDTAYTNADIVKLRIERAQIEDNVREIERAALLSEAGRKGLPEARLLALQTQLVLDSTQQTITRSQEVMRAHEAWMQHFRAQMDPDVQTSLPTPRAFPSDLAAPSYSPGILPTQHLSAQNDEHATRQDAVVQARPPRKKRQPYYDAPTLEAEILMKYPSLAQELGGYVPIPTMARNLTSPVKPRTLQRYLSTYKIKYPPQVASPSLETTTNTAKS